MTKKQRAVPKPPLPVNPQTYPWPPTNPVIRAESVEYADLVPKADDDDIRDFVIREPYWKQVNDAYERRMPLLLASRPFTKLSQVPSLIHVSEFNAMDGGRNMIWQQINNDRRFYIKEAEFGKGKTFALHKDCWIVFDGNPPSARYNGSNRYNVAQLDRLAVVEVTQWTRAEVTALLSGAAEVEKLVSSPGSHRDDTQGWILSYGQHSRRQTRGGATDDGYAQGER